MEPAEGIVKEWLQKVRKQFTMENVHYPINRGKTGSNYGDIDIIGVDADGIFYDYEVKWSKDSTIGATSNQSAKGIINSFKNPGREEVFRALGINTVRQVRKTLIVPKIFFGKKPETREKHEFSFKKEGISVIYFEDVLRGLLSYSRNTTKDDSTVIRLIRSMIDFLPSELNITYKATEISHDAFRRE